MSEFVDKYLERVEIKPSKNMEGFYSAIENASNIETVHEIERIMDGRAEGNPDEAIYKIMNSNLNMVKAFCGGFDGAFLKKLFNKIEKYKQYIGTKVIDVGCNNGIITCFIASLCPDSQIVGVDICNDGIERARELAQELNLSNVQFSSIGLDAVRDKFDTVFCSKISHEVVDFEKIDWYGSRENIISQGKGIFDKYVSTIKSILSEEGYLFSIDRIPYNILIYSYYLALSKRKIMPIMDSYSKVMYLSVGDKESIPFVVCQNGQNDEKAIADVFEPILDEEEG